MLGAKVLPEAMVIYCLKNIFQILFEILIFNRENAFENVVLKMAAILFRPHWANQIRDSEIITEADMANINPVDTYWPLKTSF